MKLLNQKAKVTFYFFFDRNQPMTQPSAGNKKSVSIVKCFCQIDRFNSRTFVRAPPSGVTFDFDYSTVSAVAMALLKEDQQLQKMRYR